MKLAQFAASITVLVAPAFLACDDGTGPNLPTGTETAVVVNSIDLSITVFPTDTPTKTLAIGLAPTGSPVSVAARNNLVVVPMGFLAAAAIIDLRTGMVTTVPLPENSGATGAAFLNDSIVYVGNPNLNTVSRINVQSGTHEAEIDVGIYPQAIAVTVERILVMNAELDENFQPAREGVVSVIDPSSNSVVGSFSLGGFNPSAAEFRDGLLYIVNSGRFGMGDGSLSVVNPSTPDEIEHHVGFGEFPGDIAFDDAGDAYVSSFFYGIAVWDAAAESFVHPPDDPLVIGGHTTASGLGFDADGRLYSLAPGDCVSPGVVVRAEADLSFDREIEVGVCPIAIAFTHVQGP
ncbi:MAG: YncE family protein [Gemmatimonadetes bacterium]|uniref:YncE family protein n=1 Tax=Candidatus Kutchimonas denitrificans TaxID=3056748 RepID=A0AAE4Z9K0_9BACT|nr:YncE family protein [Gemmatimonadota bacterium]NIR74006.1 YncE family protein [Candidatus Kutchimonas denitrificans]NIS02995.1 YncE family protein [Gemmatimonadota bacterium]NIT68712.1 YncE family protein [Gemmatimonadota bacterium]NIU53293.1 hypothetical protein [Gemmatimonadota bacterium]